MECISMPQKKKLKITKIFDEIDNELKISLPGENLKILIDGLHEDDINRGNVLCGK